MIPHPDGVFWCGFRAACPWHAIHEERLVGFFPTKDAADKALEEAIAERRAQQRRQQIAAIAILLIFALLGAAVGWTVLTIALAPPAPSPGQHHQTIHDGASILGDAPSSHGMALEPSSADDSREIGRAHV